MFVAPRMIPYFNAIWGCSKRQEKDVLSRKCQKVLKVLRKEWEMATVRPSCSEAGSKKRRTSQKRSTSCNGRMKVVPQEVLYVPKFTYIWTLAEARFPEEIADKMKPRRSGAGTRPSFLEMCGMTLLGDLSRHSVFTVGIGQANHQLVDEGFAERIGTRAYISCRRSEINCLASL